MNHETTMLNARHLIEYVLKMKERSHYVNMILKTTVHLVIEAFENDDEMSCFAPYFRDEGADASIYSFCRPLTNNHLPKFKSSLPHMQHFNNYDI